ncbi:hypothetical protein ASD04_17855 [Devosia sp. Root436]|nr:hypothetical protein ASD04_17855 [Devosia sp. Root436]
MRVKSPNTDPKRGGATVEQTFNAQFRSVSTTETREIMDRAGENGTIEFIQAIVLDWDESVVDDDGQPVAFSDAALADMLANVWVLKAFWTAWSESTSGQAAGTKK